MSEFICWIKMIYTSSPGPGSGRRCDIIVIAGQPPETRALSGICDANMIQILIVLILIDQTKTFKTYFAASWLLELAWELGNLHNSMKTSRLWLAAASRWRGLSCDWLAHLSIIPPQQEYDWMRSLAGIAALAPALVFTQLHLSQKLSRSDCLLSL